MGKFPSDLGWLGTLRGASCLWVLTPNTVPVGSIGGVARGMVLQSPFWSRRSDPKIVVTHRLVMVII